MATKRQLFSKSKAGIVLLIAAVAWLYAQSKSINDDWVSFSIFMSIAIMLGSAGYNMWKRE
jgi:hypothetical protein